MGNNWAVVSEVWVVQWPQWVVGSYWGMSRDRCALPALPRSNFMMMLTGFTHPHATAEVNTGYLFF